MNPSQSDNYNTKKILTDTDKVNHECITKIYLSSVNVLLKKTVSNATILTGKQKELSAVSLLKAEIGTGHGLKGLGFTTPPRVRKVAQFVLACEVVPAILGKDHCNIAKLWMKLVWASASVGRSGLSAQAIATINTMRRHLTSKQAGLTLAKQPDSLHDAVPCDNTSGGYLQASMEEMMGAADRSLERGMSGIKITAGHPDRQEDVLQTAASWSYVGEGNALLSGANPYSMKKLRLARVKCMLLADLY
ncbi:hypothetical protein [Martelella alba]|uniref:Uncharacterized protein n=1 Tax=Martelella alba TaxID=2590451 RepID=A0ABY2SE96_9HYPH|nr:hypothetical protein [Martelella alba]TKI03058.1 hypothetical protein FCN80_22995 [Martelella alba]